MLCACLKYGTKCDLHLWFTPSVTPVYEMQFKPSYLLGLNELVGLVYVQNLGLLMKRARVWRNLHAGILEEMVVLSSRSDHNQWQSAWWSNPTLLSLETLLLWSDVCGGQMLVYINGGKKQRIFSYTFEGIFLQTVIELQRQ